MTDQEIIEKIDTVLKKLHKFFREIEPEAESIQKNGIKRSEYFNQHPEFDDDAKSDFPFSLKPQNIIDEKLPFHVAGCTGRARLFSYYAEQIGLKDFYVVLTARISDLEKYANKQLAGQIWGHQLIAVKLTGSLHPDHLCLIDPGRSDSFNTARLPYDCVVNGNINYSGEPYTISAIFTPEQYDNIDSYAKIKDVYLSSKTARKILLNTATKEMENKTKNKFIQYESNDRIS